jgi:hypothetical protein
MMEVWHHSQRINILDVGTDDIVSLCGSSPWLWRLQGRQFFMNLVNTEHLSLNYHTFNFNMYIAATLYSLRENLEFQWPLW